MVSFRSAYAYPLMYYMLSHKEFKQRKMARDLGYKHGGSVSNFVKGLEDLRFVEKFRDHEDDALMYRVTSPVGLIRFYSNFRRMDDIRLSLDMGESRRGAMEFFKKNNGIFCLTTALENYSEYVKDPSIHVYVDQDYWNDMEKKESDGNVRVNLYVFKPYREDNVTEINDLKVTTRLRTLIDLYCDDKAYAAEPLIKQIWT